MGSMRPDNAVTAISPATVPAERLAARFSARRTPLGDPGYEARGGRVGLTAPQAAGLVIVHGTTPGPGASSSAVLPLGPDRWLAVHETLPRGVSPGDLHRGADDGSRVVGGAEDVSHAFTRIRVAGDDPRRVLATGIAIDLHPGAFPAGASAVTAYREVFVVLHAVDGDVVDVYVLRSFARTLWRWLHAAADR